MTRAVGPFLLELPLGQGGMGSVWRARHQPSGAAVAVKLVLPHLSRQSWVAPRFLGEVRAVARLDHPHVVRVLDVGLAEEEVYSADGALAAEAGSPWLAMELLEGPPLYELCGRLPWERALVLLMQLLDALGHAHARGVIHRDLKPGNVQVVSRGAVLLDFGLALARVARQGPEPLDAGSGTAAYMAPEQVRGDDHLTGPATDLYAFGCLAWALFTGVPPFGRSRPHAELCQDQLYSAPPAFSPRCATPPGVEAFLLRCLAKRVEDRFATAAEASAALRALAGFPPSPWPPPAEPPPLARPPMVLVGAGLGLHELRRLPVIGRGPEKQALWSEILALRSGLGGVVVLQGGAGCGKSSLAAALGERAAELGLVELHTVVHGETTGPEDGVGPAIARMLRVRGLLAEQVHEQLEREPGLREADRRALLSLLTGRPAGVAERHAALRGLLELRSGRRPLLLWIEDAQWGADALALVAHLATWGSLSRWPILAVITAREMAEESAEAQLLTRILATPRARRIEVGPLAPGHRHALIHEVLRVDDPLARDIERRTEGNPLFAVQLVGEWIKRGALVPGEAGFVLQAGLSPELPADLHALWQERVGAALQGRPASEREALELAAILGMSVDAEEWAQAVRRAGLWASGGLVEHLVRAGLLQPPVGGAFTFIHALLRESLVRSAKAGGRAGRWHRAAAAVLADQGERARLRLGRHLLALGAWEEALPALTAGAWGLVRQSEYLAADIALADRERAVAALGLSPEDPRRVEGALMRARVARRRGDHAAARAFAAEAEAGARSGGHRALRVEALREESRHAQHEGRRREALRLLEAAEGLCEPGLKRAWVQRDRGLLLVALGREAGPSLRVAAATFTEAGEDFGRATCLVGVATEAARKGAAPAALLDEAETAFTRAMAAQEPVWSLAGLGDVARLRGDLELAVQRYDAAIERLKEIGAPGTDELRLQHARALLALGRVDAARPVLRQLLATVISEARPGLLASVYAYHALAASISEDWGGVDRLLNGIEREVRAEGEPDAERDQVIGELARRCAEAGEATRADRALTLLSDGAI